MPERDRKKNPMAVSQRLRYEILRRDNHACRYCGATAPDVKLHVDHVIPQALGGSDAPTNLVTACAGCNAGKTSSMPGAEVVADVDQNAFRKAAHLKGEATTAANELRGHVGAHLYATWMWAWTRSGKSSPDHSDVLNFADDLRELLERGLSARLGLTELVFRAGADQAADLNTYLPDEYLTPEDRAVRVPLTTEEAKRGGSIYAAWWDGWEQRSPTGPTNRVDRKFSYQLRQVLRMGHEQNDIRRAAGAAGLNLSPELSAYLPDRKNAEPENPPSQAIPEQIDHELTREILDGWQELGTVADAWCEAWRDASPDGIEPETTPQEFKDSLGLGIRSGLSIDELRQAARRAGAKFDGNLMAHLSGSGAEVEC